jgi:hypothetical protein
MRDATGAGTALSGAMSHRHSRPEQPHFGREARERIGRIYDTDIEAYVSQGSVWEDI